MTEEKLPCLGLPHVLSLAGTWALHSLTLVGPGSLARSLPQLLPDHQLLHRLAPAHLHLLSGCLESDTILDAGDRRIYITDIVRARIR